MSIRPVDLAVAVGQSTRTPVQGGPLDYRIVVSNAGATPAVGPITVSQTLPTAVGALSATGESWTCSISGGTVICQRALGLAMSESAHEIVVRSVVIDGNGASGPSST